MPWDASLLVSACGGSSCGLIRVPTSGTPLARLEGADHLATAAWGPWPVARGLRDEGGGPGSASVAFPAMVMCVELSAGVRLVPRTLPFAWPSGAQQQLSLPDMDDAQRSCRGRLAGHGADDEIPQL